MERSHSRQYLSEVSRIAQSLKYDELDFMAESLAKLRENGGRLFFLGLGGSAANASHAVNDFRKLCGFECYSPSDNVSELTAIANDEGWMGIYSRWLDGSRLTFNDAIFILSVGGGTDKVSLPLKLAINFAKSRSASIFGIVGRDGGETARTGDCVIRIPTVESIRVTPHTEAFQSVVLHLLVSHPLLQRNATKW